LVQCKQEDHIRNIFIIHLQDSTMTRFNPKTLLQLISKLSCTDILFQEHVSPRSCLHSLSILTTYFKCNSCVRLTSNDT
jgi:hypothetical protein